MGFKRRPEDRVVFVNLAKIVKPKVVVDRTEGLPFGMSKIKHPCPLCRSSLFYLEGVIKCNGCNYRKDCANVNTLFSKQ